MEGLSPATGLLTFNPTRARGQGADDMLVTSAGLWIASDNPERQRPVWWKLPTTPASASSLCLGHE